MAGKVRDCGQRCHVAVQLRELRRVFVQQKQRGELTERERKRRIVAVCFCFPAEYVEEDMSLLSEAMEKCVLLDKRTQADGYGGYTSSYVDGAEFKAAIVFDSSMQARQAAVQGVTALYTVTTEKAINLQYHDVFRRVRDGKILRVTSDGDDKHTPGSASLNMRQVSAEEWELTHG